MEWEGKMIEATIALPGIDTARKLAPRSGQLKCSAFQVHCEKGYCDTIWSFQCPRAKCKCKLEIVFPFLNSITISNMHSTEWLQKV